MTRHAVHLGLALLLHAVSGVSNVKTILLDASNLQFSLRPGLSNKGLCSQDFHGVSLPAYLDSVAKVVGAEKIHAQFDGRSFGGMHAEESWECDAEIPNATPIHVSFTGELTKADDVLVDLAQELGREASSPSPEIVTSGYVRSLLEQPIPAPKPVFCATLLKSAMGKGKRSKREAFLNTCGLRKMGDMVHLPAFDESQQQRSLALVRGLHSLERGVVRLEKLGGSSTMVVSDDRGLRRRCFLLANPPVVFGRMQFFNFMERLMLEKAEQAEAGEEVVVVEE